MPRQFANVRAALASRRWSHGLSGLASRVSDGAPSRNAAAPPARGPEAGSDHLREIFRHHRSQAACLRSFARKNASDQFLRAGPSARIGPAGAAGFAAGFAAAAGVTVTVSATTTLVGAVASAGADFEAVPCDCARLGLWSGLHFLSAQVHPPQAPPTPPRLLVSKNAWICFRLMLSPACILTINSQHDRLSPRLILYETRLRLSVFGRPIYNVRKSPVKSQSAARRSANVRSARANSPTALPCHT